MSLAEVTDTPVIWWKMKGGKSIAITDMTNDHLINTIKMLRRQIDGSAHDDFVHHYVFEMEKVLKGRGYNIEKLRAECFPYLYK